MRFLLYIASVLALSATAVAAAVRPRQNEVLAHGTIKTPLNGAAIAPGESFDFDYAQANICESGYSPIAVYLLGQPAVETYLDANGQVPDDISVYEFGNYTIANFGLPPMSPPPSSFVMPDMSDTIEAETTLYLAVVETYMYCPGDVATEYGITGNNILYSA